MPDLDEDLVVAGLGLWSFLVLKDLGAAVFVEYNRLHVLTFRKIFRICD
jgi:hypothetical protein